MKAAIIIIIKEGWWKAGEYEGDGSVEAAVSGNRNFRFVGEEGEWMWDVVNGGTRIGEVSPLIWARA